MVGGDEVAASSSIMEGVLLMCVMAALLATVANVFLLIPVVIGLAVAVALLSADGSLAWPVREALR